MPENIPQNFEISHSRLETGMHNILLGKYILIFHILILGLFWQKELDSEEPGPVSFPVTCGEFNPDAASVDKVAAVDACTEFLHLGDTVPADLPGS